MLMTREFLNVLNGKVPIIWIKTRQPIGGAVVIHGYGGCKEEMVGLAWRIAETGLAVCTIDLCGHGENEQPLSMRVLPEVEEVIRQCRHYGKVTAVGHSLGGRLALVSQADYAIAISPALAADYSNETKGLLKQFRSYRVRETNDGMLYHITAELPLWQPDAKQENAAVIFGSRDIPEIIDSCRRLELDEASSHVLEQARHTDIFTYEVTIRRVTELLMSWYASKE